MNEEYKRLVEELNSLSTNFDEQSRMRMKEIAKILLTDYYKYLPRKKNKNDNGMGELLKGNGTEGE